MALVNNGIGHSFEYHVPLVLVQLSLSDSRKRRTWRPRNDSITVRQRCDVNIEQVCEQHSTAILQGWGKPPSIVHIWRSQKWDAELV